MKTAVISGGAGGLGRAMAARLQGQGWRCYLLDIDISGLVENDLQRPLTCDLTDAAQLEATTGKILSQSPAVDLVIYNAGITHIGPFEGLDDITLRKLFEINFFAATNMARAFLRPVRAARGTHLAISSVAGFSPLFHRTAYAASKHALEGFFSSLRSEEAPHGVTTVIAAPSFVATNIGNDARQADGTARPGSASDGIDYMSAETAAAVILRGAARGTDFVPVGRVARLGHLIHRASPRLFRHLMERKIAGQ